MEHGCAVPASCVMLVSIATAHEARLNGDGAIAMSPLGCGCALA